MVNYLEFRNVSTILTSILLTIFGALLGYLSSMGFNLPVSADFLASVTGAVILGVFSYYNAKNHNNFFDKETDTIYVPVTNLTDAQAEGMNEFIETHAPGTGDDNDK